MLLEKSFYSFCNVIRFEPGNIPLAKHWLNLFVSPETSTSRLRSALWPSNLSQKEITYSVKKLAQNLDVLSPLEQLGNLFTISIAYRLASLSLSSLKLYIEKSKIHDLSYHNNTLLSSSTIKMLLSALTSLIAPALLWGIGFPSIDLLLNEALVQTVGSCLQFVSHRTSNFLTQLDLVSYTKSFKPLNYVSKIFSVFAIDNLMTMLGRGASAVFTSQYTDSYPALKFCMSKDNNISSFYKLVYDIKLQQPLISLLDKLTWMAGRMVVDLFTIKYANDIRSPFFNVFAQGKKTNFIDKIKASIQIKRDRLARLEPEETITSEITTYPVSNIVTPEIPETENRTEEKYRVIGEQKTKVKRRGGSTQPHQLTAATETEENIEDSVSITIGGHQFYPLFGRNIPRNTYAVMTVEDRSGNFRAYQRAVENGRVAPNANIRHLAGALHSILEAGPSGEDDRIMGEILPAERVLNKLCSSEASMCGYQHLLEIGRGEEPYIVDFSARCKHEDITKTARTVARCKHEDITKTARTVARS